MKTKTTVVLCKEEIDALDVCVIELEKNRFRDNYQKRKNWHLFNQIDLVRGIIKRAVKGLNNER